MFRKLLSKIRKSKSESDLHEDSITVATFTNSFNDKVLMLTTGGFILEVACICLVFVNLWPNGTLSVYYYCWISRV